MSTKAETPNPVHDDDISLQQVMTNAPATLATATSSNSVTNVLKLCISYSSNDKELVEHAILGLKAYGHDVFYGPDVKTMNGEDWVRQWGDECKKSDV